MSETEEETQTVELEEAQVVDPEEYNQNKRLREIHEARSDFMDAYTTPSGEFDNYRNPVEARNIRTAEFLTLYVANVEPVLRKTGLLEEFLNEEVLVPKSDDKNEIGELYRSNFVIVEGDNTEAITQIGLKNIYRKTNEYLDKIGLGIEIQENEEGLKL
jgi:hypothetical protein